MKLTPRESQALDSLCDTFVPSLAFGKDEDPALFSMSANDLGVSARVADALDIIEPAKCDGLRFFLGLLENPLFIASVSAKATRFSRLSQSDREGILQRLANSVVPQLRSAYQGVRSLVMLHTYAANGTPESDALLSAIGYEPEINKKATAPRVPVVSPGSDATIECDVCVVGSGAAGSVVAAELAASGKSVIVVEAGGTWSDGDFDQHELIGLQRLFREGGLAGTRDLSMTLLAGSSLGGGTTVNWQSCFRTPDNVREEWARISGCRFFATDSFTESLDAVWQHIGASTDESEINENNGAICRGAKSLGYSWSVIARNSLGCDAAQCGNCMFGCRVGGKQSAATTYLMAAIRSGAQVIAPFTARKLVQSKGKVTGVEGTYSDPDGERRALTIVAPRVVLAAGALETPALLMRSGVKSSHLGENLFLHPTVAVTATASAARWRRHCCWRVILIPMASRCWKMRSSCATSITAWCLRPNCRRSVASNSISLMPAATSRTSSIRSMIPRRPKCSMLCWAALMTAKRRFSSRQRQAAQRQVFPARRPISRQPCSGRWIMARSVRSICPI